MPILSYKFRLKPSREQTTAAADMLGDFCSLYNAGLEERINAFQSTANARHEVVWGEWTDRKGKTHEGYVGRHLANVPADKTKRVGYGSQTSA
jgi:hypothetical protein